MWNTKRNFSIVCILLFTSSLFRTSGCQELDISASEEVHGSPILSRSITSLASSFPEESSQSLLVATSEEASTTQLSLNSVLSSTPVLESVRGSGEASSTIIHNDPSSSLGSGIPDVSSSDSSKVADTSDVPLELSKSRIIEELVTPSFVAHFSSEVPSPTSVVAQNSAEVLSSSVAVAEDRIGYISDLDDSNVQLIVPDLPPLELSRADLARLQKGNRQNNPSIEQLISGLVNLLGGDVKTDRRRPSQRLPPRRRPPPPRLPIQPRPSLVKIPSFPTSSRLNNRGPSKFNGIHAGINIGVPARPVNTPTGPSEVPSYLFSTKEKPNRWEWPDFSGSVSSKPTVTEAIQPTSTLSAVNLPSSSVTPIPSPVVDDFYFKKSSSQSSVVKNPSSFTKSEASSSEEKTPELPTTTSSINSITEIKVQATVQTTLTSKSIEPSGGTPSPPIISVLSSTSIITKSPIVTESSVSIVKSLSVEDSSSNVIPSSSIEVTPSNVAPSSSVEVTPLNVVPSSVSVSPSSGVSSSPVSIDSSISSPPTKESSSTNEQFSPSGPVTEWKPVVTLSSKTTPLRTSRTSEVQIITAPSIIDITVTNSMAGSSSVKTSVSTPLLKPFPSSSIPSLILNTEFSTSSTTLLLPSPSKQPTRPSPSKTRQPEVVTIQGQGSLDRPLSTNNDIRKKPTRPGPTPGRLKPSRPSSIGRPTVIPVELDNVRSGFGQPPRNSNNRFPVRGSGNNQVVGSGISFVGNDNTNGLRPVRPPPSRPKRPPFQRFKPNLPPLRIDTCVVGEDSTCDHKLNEQCRTEQGVSSCVCRPGYARTGSRGPCFSVVSLVASVKIDKFGNRRLGFNAKLLDKGTKEYETLKTETEKAINSAFRFSKFRGMFYGSLLNKFYAIGGKVHVNTTVLLEKNPKTMSENIRHDIQRELIRVIASRNQNIGNSLLSVEGPLNPVPGVQDLNECSESTLNDCAEHSICQNVFGTFKCKCKPGYLDKFPKDQLRSGRYCSTCSPKFCNNHGDCVVNNGKQECICKGSYIGARCDIDGEVLGVALGVSLAAIIIIILTLVCLFSWSRRWKQEQQKIDHVSARTSASSGNTFTYIDKSGKNGTNSFHDDRMRWTDSVNNYYASEPVVNSTHSIYSGLYPPMPGNSSRPMTPKNNHHIDNQYHVPRPRSRASHAGSLYYDSRDLYSGRKNGYAIPLRPMRS